jgi:hypothetical protein
MSKSIYLVNPRADFPAYFAADVFEVLGGRPAIHMADLAVATVAALAPPDFEVRICDEHVTPIDFDTSADFVAITGKVSQWHRMVAIAREFRERRGKLVLMGGPNASLDPDAARGHCDVLVRGEAEEIAGDLFRDLREGTWRSEYVGTRPDLASSPMPRWDLYPNDRALMGTIQTSRGCPFECEFCDVIQYLGRKQRHKAPAQVVTELDLLYRLGYRRIFLADDNFTAHRNRCKELLEVLRTWNRAREHGPVLFTTQVSIDAARDDELLRMCAEAGLVQVFIGIETPNRESLRESKKRQNLKFDLAGEIQKFIESGISVIGGMIVGFDADGPDIFERQYEFAMSTPVPLFTLGALVAPVSTPLHARLRQAGRLLGSDAESSVIGTAWETNVIPLAMSREEMLDGVRSLCRDLYSPAAFGERVLHYIRSFGARRDPGAATVAADLSGLRSVDLEGISLLGHLARLGREEAVMWSRVRAGLHRRPELSEFVIPFLIQYLQIRYMYQRGDVWASEHPGLRATAAATAWA